MIPLIIIIVAIAGLILGGSVRLIFLPTDPLGSLIGLVQGLLIIVAGVSTLVLLIILWSFKRFRAKLLMRPYHVEFVNFPNELYRIDIIGSPTHFNIGTKSYIIGALLHGKYGFHNWDDTVPIDLNLDMPWTIAKVFSSDEAHDLIEDLSLIKVEQARRRISIGSSLLGIGIVIIIILEFAGLGFGLSTRDLVIEGFNIIFQSGILPEAPPIAGPPDLGG